MTFEAGRFSSIPSWPAQLRTTIDSYLDPDMRRAEEHDISKRPGLMWYEQVARWPSVVSDLSQDLARGLQAINSRPDYERMAGSALKYDKTALRRLTTAMNLSPIIAYVIFTGVQTVAVEYPLNSYSHEPQRKLVTKSSMPLTLSQNESGAPAYSVARAEWHCDIPQSTPAGSLEQKPCPYSPVADEEIQSINSFLIDRTVSGFHRYLETWQPQDFV